MTSNQHGDQSELVILQSEDPNAPLIGVIGGDAQAQAEQIVENTTGYTIVQPGGDEQPES